MVALSNTAPFMAPTGLPGATAVSRYVGATASGAPVSGTFQVGDYVVDRTGSIWICTAAGSPGTWGQVGAGVTLDSTAGHFAPDGVQSAGALGTAARADHVHPEQGWQSGYWLPTGALRETFPRVLANATAFVPATTDAYLSAITLYAGDVVSNISLYATAAQSGGSHAWVALLDSTRKVLAVSADQTGATYFSPANSFITTSLGGSFTVTTSGLYFIAFSATASSMPQFIQMTVPNSHFGLATPILGGFSGVQSTPPALAATLTAVSVVGGQVYAYVS